ncbi:uncharacterized protein [Drosophila takahashii]|uniref:uncharacterized protein n=1 Tax=Drosophila takahashii TaxID=29030 RepID=UPI001CF83DBE|nr:uncharacterized protein LOC108061210 [Drosophila takahashii]
MVFGCKQCVLIVVILCVIAEIASRVEFSNIKCTSHDLEFVAYEACYLKSVNRTYKYATVKSRLLKLPITNAIINIALFQRLNGYKPFLYNVSVDACRFLKTKRSNPVITYLLNLFVRHSNLLNTTCPYKPYINVEKLTASFLNNQMTNVLQFPEGDYLFESKWFNNKTHRSTVNVYVTINS